MSCQDLLASPSSQMSWEALASQQTLCLGHNRAGGRQYNRKLIDFATMYIRIIILHKRNRLHVLKFLSATQVSIHNPRAFIYNLLNLKFNTFICMRLTLPPPCQFIIIINIYYYHHHHHYHYYIAFIKPLLLLLLLLSSSLLLYRLKGGDYTRNHQNLNTYL